MAEYDELQNEIIDLKWHALPYYERWAYPKSVWKHKKFYLKRRLQTQKGEVRYTHTLVIILLIFATATLIFPGTSWKFTALLGFSAIIFYAIEIVMKKRLAKIRRARKLKKAMQRSSQQTA